MRGRGIIRLIFWVPYILSRYTWRKNLSIGGTYYSSLYSNSFEMFKDGNIDFWITRERELVEPRVLYIYSLKSIWVHLICDKVYVDYGIKDLLWFLIGGARVNNLWHGMPIKKIENDIETGALAIKFSKERKYFLKRLMYYQDSFCNYHSVLVNSVYHENILKSAFNSDKLLLGRSPRIRVWGSKRESTSETKKVAFCLTFNDEGKDPFLLRYLLDFQEQYSACAVEIIIVLHPRDRFLFNSLQDEGVRNLKLGFDPSNFGRGDVLISEQSSLLFDADLAEVETGLLVFEQQDLRDQYLDLSEFLDVKQVIRNAEEISVFLNSVIDGYTGLGWTKKLSFV